MMLQQKSPRRRTGVKGMKKSVLGGSDRTTMRSPVEGVLRDLAFVLHATAVVRQAMEAKQAVYSAAS